MVLLLLAFTAGSPPILEGQALPIFSAQEREQYPVDIHRVGVLLPLTGRFAQPGLEVKRGLDLAAKELFASGGHRITLVYRDTQDDPELAAQAVQSLVAQDQVVAIIGPLVSATVDAAALAAAQLEVPLLVLSQKDEIPYMGTYAFRFFMTPDAQIRRLVDYAMGTLELQRFGLIYPKQRYGMELAGLFWDEVVARGGEIVLAEAYDPGAKDFLNLARRVGGKFYLKPREEERREGLKAYKHALKESGMDEKKIKEKAKKHALPPIVDYDALFIPANRREASLIAASLAFMEIPVGKFLVHKNQKPVRLLGSSAWNNHDLLRQGGAYVEFSIFVDQFFLGSPEVAVREFARAFEEDHGRAPSLFAALGYDSVDLMSHLLGKGRTDRMGLRDRLREVDDFKGVTGLCHFDVSGELDGPLHVITVRRGQFRQLEPPVESKDGKKGAGKRSGKKKKHRAEAMSPDGGTR